MVGKLARQKEIIAAPSILSADSGHLAEAVRAVDAAGANAIVAGSAIFESGDYAAAIAAIHGASRPFVGNARS